jgi:hypothetical protein
MLMSFVDESSLVTPEQMERWGRDFDNRGTVDTVALSARSVSLRSSCEALPQFGPVPYFGFLD